MIEVKSFLRAFLCVMLVSFASACTATPVAGALSRKEALRIADAEARREMRVDLSDYEHSAVTHDTKQGWWYVGYRRKGKTFDDFGFHVYDKTGRAWRVMED